MMVSAYGFPFPSFFGAFAALRVWIFSSISIVNISPSVYRSIVSISPCSLSGTGLSPCYSPHFLTIAFSVLHSQGDRSAVLVLLDSHIFKEPKMNLRMLFLRCLRLFGQTFRTAAGFFSLSLKTAQGFSCLLVIPVPQMFGSVTRNMPASSG